MILISIILPVYNCSLYLENCVSSVINQTYKDFELIIVDDGSTDGSSKICDKLAQIDDRIRVFHIPNGGVSAARNYGIKRANGEYIGFIDSDDAYDISMLEILTEYLTDEKLDVIQCGYQIMYSNDLRQDDYCIDFDYKKSFDYVYDLFYPRKKISNSIWNKLFKKSCLSGIFFDENIRIGEDFKFVFEVLENCSNVKLISKPLYKYFLREGSAMQSIFSTKFLDDFVVNDWLLNKYKKINYLKKLIKTRDAECCLSVYLKDCIGRKNKDYIKLIKDRLKKNKERYRLDVKRELLIFLISNICWLFNLMLNMKYRKSRVKIG